MWGLRVAPGRHAVGVLVVALLALGGSACTGAQTPAGPPTTAAPGTSASSTTPPPPTTTTPPTTTRPAPPLTTTTTTTTTTTAPTPAPRILLRPGDTGRQVRELQARLRQIGWFEGDVTDHYGTRTTAAVSGFQARRGLPATGVLDERTWQRLLAMTHEPTANELDNVAPPPRPLAWDVDSRCLTGSVICISKTTRSLTVVRDGTPRYAMDVRFGSELEPTREGVFHITWKKVDVVSTIYYTPMPYSMFFSGGQAIHYSSNFARLGYDGSSHGCVNVRDWGGMVRLYNETPVGTTVVIHW